VDIKMAIAHVCLCLSIERVEENSCHLIVFQEKRERDSFEYKEKIKKTFVNAHMTQKIILAAGKSIKKIKSSSLLPFKHKNQSISQLLSFRLTFHSSNFFIVRKWVTVGKWS
jgi:hypothetical protein